MKQFIERHQWEALSMPERDVIRNLFKIQHTGGGMDVQGGQIISDGTTGRDLAVVNIGHMMAYLELESSEFCNELWEKVKVKALKDIGKVEVKDVKPVPPAPQEKEEKLRPRRPP